MDLYKVYEGARMSWPVTAFELWARIGAESVRGRMIGVSLDEPEIRKRQREMPVQKARIGAVALQEGSAAHDTELQLIGEAMVVQALADVHDIPQNEAVQQAVTDVASKVIDEVGENPYIAPLVVDKAALVLDS